MKQSELSKYESSGERCPSCGQICETRRSLGYHHSCIHGESLREYEATGIECPRGCGQFEMLGVHWGVAHDDPFPDDKPSMTEDVRNRLSDTQSEKYSGEGNPMYGRFGEDHPKYGITHSEETKKKQSDGLKAHERSEEHKRALSAALKGRELSEAHKQAIHANWDGGTPSQCCIIPTQHEVRSGWEREIDLLLHDNGYGAEYEPGPFEIENGRKYTPDFRVEGDIIEVKGYKWGDSDKRAELFMERYPEYRYIAVGTEIPADVWLPWEDRDRLVKVLKQ